ncbi:hypothetical protein [Chryseobacterium sp. HSC-36S06]|uniref:hypothetical protein n=1 Tax=Chryseobacterium sp. HSC-36S06 TaxID=2910970 RepID=UPI00209FC03E|nr:hypothetical protein [Chryseobacterium sp. HSC-36S06]MCP2038184.1 tetrahydromethanopterin S-methyltransferase subunit A [Chryseobacterium sp. HSC-36S06]
MIDDNSKEKVFYESDGRMYKRESFTKRIPRKTFITGRFRGKFHADIVKNLKNNADFFHFKIYSAEVEILKKSKEEEKVTNAENKIKIEASQMPEEVFFYERKGDEKIYYDIKFEERVFHNFKFISKLQQNEGEEAFGTIEADFYGYLVDFLEEERYRKIYKKINLVKCEDCIPTDEKTGNVERQKGRFREEYFCKEKDKTYWGEWIEIPVSPPGTETSADTIKRPKEWISENVSPCLRDLFLSALVVLLSLIFGFTPTFIIGVIWLLYVVYKCYLHWFKYLFYFLGLLFLFGLIYSILNTDWGKKQDPYIPHIKKEAANRPKLVKVINLINPDSSSEDVLIVREMTWSGYNGERYQGKFIISKSDLDASRNFKNSLRPISYESILYSIEKHDTNRIKDIYHMFESIRESRNLNDKLFAEMVVSFVQSMPYYVVLEESCNPEQYPGQMIKSLIQQNPGRCAPNNKFGITTPLEFLATGQGDCDSRTLLSHTILKHFGFDTAILSSDIYQHSILGVNLPYKGQVYEDGSSRYALWETTDKGFKPGVIPSEVRNLNYWRISIK